MESIEQIDARRTREHGTADLETISEIGGYSAGLSDAPRVPPRESLRGVWFAAYDEGVRDRAQARGHRCGEGK